MYTTIKVVGICWLAEERLLHEKCLLKCFMSYSSTHQLVESCNESLWTYNKDTRYESVYHEICYAQSFCFNPDGRGRESNIFIPVRIKAQH